MTLNHKGKTLNGTWTEDGSLTTSISGKLTDTALVFNNTRYSIIDHYNASKPNDFEFKDAKLQLVKNADTIYITGNLQLYSTKLKEPEKPTFVMLIRNGKNENMNPVAINIPPSPKTDSIKFIAYPNPFTSTLNTQFVLKKTCMVRLVISNMMDGRIVYQSTSQQLETGEHTITLQLNGMPGTYVCTLNYGNQIKSAIVFKQ